MSSQENLKGEKTDPAFGPSPSKPALQGLLQALSSKVVQQRDLARIGALLVLCSLSVWIFPSHDVAFTAGMISLVVFFILSAHGAARRKGRLLEKVFSALFTATSLLLFVLVSFFVVSEKYPAGARTIRSWVEELQKILGEESVSMRSGNRPSIIVLPFYSQRSLPDPDTVTAYLSSRLVVKLDEEALEENHHLRVIPESTSQLLHETLPVATTPCLRKELLEQVARYSGAHFVAHAVYEGPAVSEATLRFCLQESSSLSIYHQETFAGADSDSMIFKAAEAILGLIGKPGVRYASAGQSYSRKLAIDFYLKGLRERRHFDIPKAREFFAMALAEDGDFLLAETALTKAWYDLGYDGEARLAARSTLQQLGTSPPTSTRLRHYMLARANALAVLHNWGEAISIYKSMWEMYPDYVEYALFVIQSQNLSGNGEIALATIRRIEEEKGFEISPVELALIEIERANAWLQIGNFQKQLGAAEDAVLLAEKTKSSLLLARARFFKCVALVYQEREWENACRQAREQFHAVGDKISVGKIHGTQGDGLAGRGDYEGAETEYRSALQIFTETQFHRGRVDQLVNLSMTVENGGEEYCHEAVDIASTYETLNQDLAKSNCAYFPVMARDFETAKNLYREALQGFQSSGAELDAAITLGNLAHVYHATRRLDEANSYYLRSLSASCEIGDTLSAEFSETLVRFSRLKADLGSPRVSEDLLRLGLGLLPPEERETWLADLLPDIEHVLYQVASNAWWEDLTRRCESTSEDTNVDDIATFCETLPDSVI